MSAFSRGSGLAIAVAVAAVCVITAPRPATAETDDAIERLLAETEKRQQTSQPRRGTEYTVVPAERPRPQDERLMLDEIEMLERARAEAEARRATMQSDDPPGIMPSPAFAHDPAEQPRIGDERRRAEQHEHDEAARRASEQQRLAEQRREIAEREAAQREATQREDEQARRITEMQQRAERAEYARMEAEREAEAVRIDEALQKARDAWIKRRNGQQYEASTQDEPRLLPPSPSQEERAREEHARNIIGRRLADADTRAADPPRSSTRVTILLVLEPGDRGIRRHNKTADPILCSENGCYVSTGASTPAELLPRRRAFGMTRTLGERAGACRNSLGCVFRGVDLAAYPAAVQPIDMRLFRHDRREPHVLGETSRCRLATGRLACTPVDGPDYVMWVVPEDVAERAGSRELERALAGGLRAHSASIAAGD